MMAARVRDTARGTNSTWWAQNTLRHITQSPILGPGSLRTWSAWNAIDFDRTAVRSYDIKIYQALSFMDNR
jgi:hypothetical protein